MSHQNTKSALNYAARWIKEMGPGKRILRATALCAVAVAATGCVKHPIKYDLESVSIARGASLKSTLDVEVLADQRAEQPQNRVLFENDHEATVNGADLCINSERSYEEGTVARQVSEMIRAHLSKRGRIQHVLLSQQQPSDYQLTGTLRSYYGSQAQSGPAKVGAMFGVVGALATANLTTPGVVRIEITDLKLLRKDGTLVAQLPNVSEVVDGDLPVDAYCWTIYFTVDEHLKDAVEKLARSVEKELERATTPQQVNTASR